MVAATQPFLVRGRRRALRVFSAAVHGCAGSAPWLRCFGGQLKQVEQLKSLPPCNQLTHISAQLPAGVLGDIGQVSCIRYRSCSVSCRTGILCVPDLGPCVHYGLSIKGCMGHLPRIIGPGVSPNAVTKDILCLSCCQFLEGERSALPTQTPELVVPARGLSLWSGSLALTGWQLLGQRRPPWSLQGATRQNSRSCCCCCCREE